MTPRAGLARMVVAVLALLAVLAGPAAALAHPLGNFTINHYAGIRVSPTEIRLDVVLDRAEIPTFQERIRLDADEDGEVSEAEADAAREPECRTLGRSLSLIVDGTIVEPTLAAAGLSFPSGSGGLSTMRLVCGFVTPWGGPPASVAFEDRSFTERVGWREIVVEGDGTTIGGEALLAASVSDRLTDYPDDQIAAPLAMSRVAFTVTPGGPSLPALVVADAHPLPGAVASGGGDSSGGAGPAGGGGAPGGSGAPSVAPDAFPGAVVPGGIGAELPTIFQATDLTPGVLLAALLAAAALGAGHALTPGHGKTLMAAYLVGTRGTALHAAGLGLSVTISHTLGILLLAVLILGAGTALPPDVVVRALPVAAGVAILVIGTWMLVAELRRRRAAGVGAGRAHDGVATHQGADTHHGAHTEAGHAHQGGHTHQGADTHEAAHAHELAHRHGQEHRHDGLDGHDHEYGRHGHTGALPPTLEHSHGGVRHTHLPPPGSTITWRSLFALGLAGGIVPSTSALLILLGSIAAGRPGFGVVLVVAFGVGMAAVLGGIGLGLVLARDRIGRLTAGSSLARLGAWVPLAAACLVIGIGLWLTGDALLGGATL